MTKISIRIVDGQVVMDMEGFKGKACLEKAQVLNKTLVEKGLKSKCTDLKKKPEMKQEVYEHVMEKQGAN